MNLPQKFHPGILVGVGLTLGGLVAATLFWFDPSNYGFYPTCIFHRTTGLLCPGCGSLRALHQLLHGNLRAAFHFNALLTVGLLGVICFAPFLFSRRIVPTLENSLLSVKWLWFFLGVALVFSVWRNIPGSPFAMVTP